MTVNLCYTPTRAAIADPMLTMVFQHVFAWPDPGCLLAGSEEQKPSVCEPRVPCRPPADLQAQRCRQRGASVAPLERRSFLSFREGAERNTHSAPERNFAGTNPSFKISRALKKPTVIRKRNSLRNMLNLARLPEREAPHHPRQNSQKLCASASRLIPTPAPWELSVGREKDHLF